MMPGEASGSQAPQKSAAPGPNAPAPASSTSPGESTPAAPTPSTATQPEPPAETTAAPTPVTAPSKSTDPATGSEDQTSDQERDSGPDLTPVILSPEQVVEMVSDAESKVPLEERATSMHALLMLVGKKFPEGKQFDKVSTGVC